MFIVLLVIFEIFLIHLFPAYISHTMTFGSLWKTLGTLSKINPCVCGAFCGTGSPRSPIFRCCNYSCVYCILGLSSHCCYPTLCSPLSTLFFLFQKCSHYSFSGLRRIVYFPSEGSDFFLRSTSSLHSPALAFMFAWCCGFIRHPTCWLDGG